jgi:hypothetical protein
MHGHVRTEKLTKNLHGATCNDLVVSGAVSRSKNPQKNAQSLTVIIAKLS